jgi:hypothetical protein
MCGRRVSNESTVNVTIGVRGLKQGSTGQGMHEHYYHVHTKWNRNLSIPASQLSSIAMVCAG